MAGVLIINSKNKPCFKGQPFEAALARFILFHKSGEVF